VHKLGVPGHSMAVKMGGRQSSSSSSSPPDADSADELVPWMGSASALETTAGSAGPPDHIRLSGTGLVLEMICNADSQAVRP
jgi:hypothetical protein